MTVEHNTLTGSQCHEPKGADSASAGQVYVADGAGGGSFQDPPYLNALTASTDHAVPRFNGTAGLIQDSGVLVDDSDNLTVPGTITEGSTLLSDKYQAKRVAAVRTSDATRNTTTLASDTALANYSLDSGATYLVEGKLYYSDGTGGAGFRSTFNTVSGSIADSGIVYIVLDPGATPNADGSGQIAIGDTFTTTSTAAQELREISVGGYVTIGNAAVLTFQWAQQLASTIDTTLHKASNLTFIPL